MPTYCRKLVELPGKRSIEGSNVQNAVCWGKIGAYYGDAPPLEITVKRFHGLGFRSGDFRCWGHSSYVQPQNT
jgi:hypothetical protein